jgi:hypothetical protein
LASFDLDGLCLCTFRNVLLHAFVAFLQLDAVKARRSAAKAFSQALDRRNAGLAASSSKGTTTAAAPAPAPARADENHPATSPHVSTDSTVASYLVINRT